MITASFDARLFHYMVYATSKCLTGITRCNAISFNDITESFQMPIIDGISASLRIAAINTLVFPGFHSSILYDILF